MKQDTQYYPWFDWLRGVLAIVVMLRHDRVLDWEQSGNFAVQVFFALSGWLIGGILIHLKPADLPRFYFNRAVRIWIPYYIGFALLIAVSLLRDSVTSKWLEIVFYKLSFVYNLFGTQQLADHGNEMPLRGTGSHFWSVNAEEQFYLLAPLLLVLVRREWARGVGVWIIIAVVAWVSHIYASIVFGVLAAVAVHRYGEFHLKKPVQAALVLILLGAVVGLFANLEYNLMAPIASIAIVLLLAQSGAQGQVGAIVGGMSYQLYLNHWIGIFIGHALLKPFGMRDSVAAHTVTFFVNIGLAVAMYWYIDRRMLAARGQMYTGARGRLIVKLAYGMVAVGLAGGFALIAMRA